jgi:acetyltransferase
LANILVRIGELAADIPEIAELDLNPVLADHQGVIAVDARIRVAAAARPDRLSIAPYPKEYESTHTLPDGQSIDLRPIRPEDEAKLLEGAAQVDPQDLRMRFFHMTSGLTREMAARLTQIDYARELALVAIAHETREGLGIVRITADPDNAKAEFAIIVRTNWKRHGLGQLLMRRIIEIAGARGIKMIEGSILRDNTAMIDLCTHLGFAVANLPDDPAIVRATLPIS